MSELIAALDELITLLDLAGQPHWRDWMADARARLQRADPSGMGSFNDLIIGYRSVPVDTTGATRMEWDDAGLLMDKRLSELRGLIAELARSTVTAPLPPS
jgi:hypothetical protein